jgi:hypothetical protein
MCGDYRFLRAGYWALIDAELNGVTSQPSPLQAATAQNAAACLLEAKRAGIDCVTWRVARNAEALEPPCILVPVAGITDASYEVRSKRSAPMQFRRATQNGTRAVLEVRADGPLRSMKMVVGVSTSPEFRLAWQVWRTFGLPLCVIHYLAVPVPGEHATPEAAMAENGNGHPARPLFLGIDPLPLGELSQRDLDLLEGVSTWPMSPS